MADEVYNTTPARQAYNAETSPEAGPDNLKGRFASALANIRLFKSNPYIKDLPEADVLELNKTLLTPYQGEQFYDDDMYVYTCKITKNELTGATEYNYISRDKENAEALIKFQATGVQNQLMSAYNNGQIYKFYVDRTNLMMYPDTSIVFPENYAFYTVRKQTLNVNKEHVYVAGIAEDGELADYHIAMKRVNDAANGVVYTRMGAASVFEITNPADDRRFDQIVSGEFYVVEFFNSDRFLVDTKYFQAEDSFITDTAVPSQSLREIKVTVLREGIVQTSGNGIYPTLSGEDLDTAISYQVRAIYNDGTVKDITDKLDTPNLERYWDETPTSTATVGQQFVLNFVYYPDIDEDRNYMGSSKDAKVTFQVVENQTDKVYKIIPVIWNTTSSTFVNESDISKIFKIKVYKLSNAGVLSNVTRAFFNTFKKQGINDSTYVEFDDCAKAYDPYEQCVTFVWGSKDGNISNEFVFQFQLWHAGNQESYRFKAVFNSNTLDVNGIFVKALSSLDKYGYETNGPFSTLKDTYKVERAADNLEYLSNTVKISILNGSYYFSIKSHTGEQLATRYKKKVEGDILTANAVQLFSVKDDTETALTEIKSFDSSVTNVSLATVKENLVTELVDQLNNYEWVLAKYYHNVENAGAVLVNFDVYAVNKSI